MTKWVYSFGGGAAEGRAEMRNLLGGKGANLAEMSALGLPVPPGFTITTEVCTWFYKHGRSYPDDYEGLVKKMVEGKLRKYLSEITLLGQPFVKDPDQTVEKTLQARGGAVARFVRFEVGEGIEKDSGDFASEVDKLIKPH